MMKPGCNSRQRGGERSHESRHACSVHVTAAVGWTSMGTGSGEARSGAPVGGDWISSSLLLHVRPFNPSAECLIRLQPVEIPTCFCVFFR